METKHLNVFKSKLIKNEKGILKLLLFDERRKIYVDMFNRPYSDDIKGVDNITDQEFFDWIRDTYLFEKYYYCLTANALADMIGIKRKTLEAYLQKLYAIRSDLMKRLFVEYVELRLFKQVNRKGDNITWTITD